LSVQTKTVSDNDAPKFNQDFDLSISKRDGLTIEVLDVKRKKVICGAHLSAAKIERLKQQGGVQSLNLRNPKDQANSGVVYLEVNSRAPRRPSEPTATARSRPHQDQDYFRRDIIHGPALPKHYERRVTSKGQVFWLNHNTGQKTWHDPRFARRRVQSEGPLPAGWEVRTLDNGRPYFINHETETTQYTDPRLEQPTTPRSRLSAPAFGVRLQSKLNHLRSELSRTFSGRTSSGKSNPALKISLRREDIFESSYRAIFACPANLLHCRLYITFDKEIGIDYGGVAREWLYLLSKQMFSPDYGLFEYVTDDDYLLQLSPISSANPDHLNYFKFIGRVLGIAIFHGHYIDAAFSPIIYKQLLSIPLSLDDLKGVDEDLHKSLSWILDNDVVENGLDDQPFTVDWDVLGEQKTANLCPNGDQITLTELNKADYVALYVAWRLSRDTSEQLEALKSGLFELVPSSFLSIFDSRELELVLCGLASIDVDDWQRNTKYGHLTADTELVTWFWSIVRSMDDVNRARLLQFCTGTSRVPVAGFKNLRGATNKDSNSVRPFSLVLVEGPPSLFPKAHTCFNRLDIPIYESREQFAEKLHFAINETMGFHDK